MPVLLPPYYTADGHMLVDGAILDNVPVRVMHELKSGPNVVISFDVPKLERFEVDYGALPGRGDLLKRMLTPCLRRTLPAAPGVGTVLMRSMMANRQDFERHLRPEDLLLVPPLPAGHGHPRLAPPHRADGPHLPLGHRRGGAPEGGRARAGCRRGGGDDGPPVTQAAWQYRGASADACAGNGHDGQEIALAGAWRGRQTRRRSIAGETP